MRESPLDRGGDAVLYVVRQDGFERQEKPMADERFLAQLWAVIESRKADESAAKSYTRELLAKPPRIRRKIIEEAYEVNEAHQALEAGHDTKDHLAHEAADLLYHLFVLLASCDVTPSEVYAVLERRHQPSPKKPAGGSP